MTILSPRLIKRCTYDGATVTTTLMLRVCHNVFYEPMLTTGPQKIGDGDQHAG